MIPLENPATFPGIDPANADDYVGKAILLAEDLAHFPKGAPILDVPCGPGYFTAFMASRMEDRIVAADIAGHQLKASRARTPEALYACGSLEGLLPFKSEAFGVVACIELVEHLVDVYAAFCELNRILRPDGKLVLTTPYHSRLKNVAVSLGSWERHFNPFFGHIRFYTRRSLSLCLESSGFRAERWNGTGRFWPFYKSFYVLARKDGPPRGRPPI